MAGLGIRHGDISCRQARTPVSAEQGHPLAWDALVTSRGQLAELRGGEADADDGIALCPPLQVAHWRGLHWHLAWLAWQGEQWMAGDA